MNTFFKHLCLVVFAALFTVVCSNFAMAATKKHKLKIAQSMYPKPSAQMDSIQRMADTIKERTDGRITFKVYGPEIGDWTELNEMVTRGDIDIMLNAPSTSFDPRWNANYAPYVVTNYDDAKKVFGPGGFMEGIYNEWAKDMNMKWMGTWIQGFAGVSLNTAPATTPEEAKGIKVRIPPVAAFECYWNKLGFTPSLIPLSEVPTAISTGVVDGQAGGNPFQTYSCCRDLNKYFVYYRDFLEVWGYVMNLDTWNKLEADDQKLFMEIAGAEALMRVDGAEKEDNAYLQKLRDHGLTVVDMQDHPERLTRARDACRECWSELDELVGKEWMDKIRAGVGMKK